jgi:hypothetical protein
MWCAPLVGHVTASGEDAGRTRRAQEGSRRGVRWLAALLPALVALGGVARPARTQGVKLGVVMNGPRSTLEQAWTEDPHQVERAYCVADYGVSVHHIRLEAPTESDTVFRVFAIHTVATTNARPASVDFACPAGMPELHTHTPTTCFGDGVEQCEFGGLNAFSCQPSREDLEKLLSRGDAFGVVQCDRRAFRFYYPSEYSQSTATAQRASPSIGRAERGRPLDLPDER